MLKREEIKERVIRVIGEELGCDTEDITENANIEDDLGGDSLDHVEIIMELETEFGIEIDDADAEGLPTVGKIINYLEKRGVK